MSLRAVLVLLVLTGTARAHKDPLGEIHPQVVPSSGGFDVFFIDNRTAGKKTPRGCVRVRAPPLQAFEPENLFVRHYGADGTALDVAKPICPEPSPQPSRNYEALLYELQGPWTYARPAADEAPRNTHLISGEGPARQHVLAFGEAEAVAAGGVDIDHQRIVLVSAGDETIRLHAVPHDRPVLGASIVLGRARHIYMFAVASPLVADRGHVIVAWIDETEMLRLSSWRPGDPTAETIRLQRVEWNTSLSLAISGDDLLIAWHEIRSKEGASIQVRHVGLTREGAPTFDGRTP